MAPCDWRGRNKYIKVQRFNTRKFVHRMGQRWQKSGCSRNEIVFGSSEGCRDDDGHWKRPLRLPLSQRKKWSTICYNMNMEQAAYMSGHPPAQYIRDLALPVFEKLEWKSYERQSYNAIKIPNDVNLFFDLCIWNFNFAKVSWFKVEVIQIGFFNIDAQLSPHDRARSWFYCSNENYRGQQKWEDQALMRLISVRSAPSSKAWTMFTTCMVLLISWPIICGSGSFVFCLFLRPGQQQPLVGGIQMCRQEPSSQGWQPPLCSMTHFNNFHRLFNDAF